MRDKTDKQLDALFAAARSEQPEISAREAHFEIRLMARLAERRFDAVPWHRMVWRMLPAFAVIAAIMLVCSFTLNPTRFGDPFAAITNGTEELTARNYLMGE